MSNLIEIQSQIEKLQKQATEIKAREFHKTVQDIVAKMQAFGITLKDLQSGKTRVGKAKGKIAKSAPKVTRRTQKNGPPVAPKYRGPNGETWSGRGLMPRWLAALIAQGKTREDFTIQS